MPRQRLIFSDARRALPQADEPEPRDPASRELIELLVGDRIERPDLAAVATRQLIEPDVRALGGKDEARHPVAIVAEPLGLDVGAGEGRRLRGARSAPAAATEPQVKGPFLLRQQVLARDEARRELRRQDAPPAVAGVPQLARERGRRVARGRAEQIDERLAAARRVAVDPEDAVDAARQRRVRLGLGDRPRVDERMEWLARGVRGGDVEEQERLEEVRATRLRTELRGQPIEDVVDAPPPELRVELGQGVAEDVRRDLLLVVVDERVADLVEEPQGDDLAGVGARGSAGCPLVQPRGKPAGGGDLIDEELAVRAEMTAVEVVSLP